MSFPDVYQRILKREGVVALRLWEKAAFWVFGWISRFLLPLLLATCKVRVFGQEIEREYFAENPGKGLLYASWHRGLFFLVYFYRNLEFIVMASASKDGELAAQATRRFGWIPVRGSSSRRGTVALKEMLELVRKGHCGGLVVDAPRGPRYISKMGIIVLSKRSGLPIMPVMWSADRFWKLRSWDRTIIPKPFSRIIFLYDDRLIKVPSNASNEECERYRQMLDKSLERLRFRTDHFFQMSGISDPRDISVSEV
jgi:lysophospholipid acyltransferase (LPLAT)-like uncharacterized protein